MEKKCCLCGCEINDFGNSSSPIRVGVCCDKCNTNFVIPARKIILDVDKINCPFSFEVSKSLEETKTIENNLKNKNFEKIENYKHIHIYSNVETDEKVVLCIIKEE